MSDDGMRKEPVRDPRLGDLLRDAEGDASLEAHDRVAMRARIKSAAELPLARLRAAPAPRGGWRESRRGVMRALAPLAAAAGIGTLIWIGADGRGGDPERQPGLAEISTLEEAFVADLSEQEFRAFVSGRANPDELLLVAAGEG